LEETLLQAIKADYFAEKKRKFWFQRMAYVIYFLMFFSAVSRFGSDSESILRALITIKYLYQYSIDFAFSDASSNILFKK
jgi:hypothetical protein